VTRKVVPLRPRASSDDGALRPRTLPRVISHQPGLSQDDLLEACMLQEQLILKHESRLTGLVARILQDRLPPLESWVAAVLNSPLPGEEEDLVEISPRDQAIQIAQPWPSIDRGLREPALPDRLDVIVEARQVIGLLSVDVDPALPVTRKQAEAANLPAHLLFARGEAFASVGEEPADEAALAAAFEAHRALLDESSDDLLDRLQTTCRRSALGDCVGVVLALGPDGNAVSVVTREQANKLLAEKPFLARKVARKGSPGTLADGREIIALPIVVWAKGHVSVQTRDVVETR
jgi:hypothetical protein